MVDSIRPMDRPNVMETTSAPRPTPTPVRVPFAKVLASVGVSAGETAMAVLPGGPMMAAALRGPGASIAMTPMSLPGQANGFSLAAEGPGASTTAAGGMSGAGGGAAGDPQAALASAQANEMAMLTLQQQVSAQQNSFMVMTNVIKSESDTEKSAIANIK